MPITTIHLLPRPSSVDDGTVLEYVSRLRPLRLKSLQTDPENFISKYESEVKEPPEFWLQRQKDPSATHIVALRGDHEPNTGDLSKFLKHDWVAFLVLIAPKDEPAEMLARESSEKTTLASSTTSGKYYMAAVYVDPSVRGQGVAKRMVQMMFEVIEEQKKKTNQKSATCVTNVLHGNTSALKLYQKLGFKVVDHDKIEEKEGRQYHTTEIKIEFTK